MSSGFSHGNCFSPARAREKGRRAGRQPGRDTHTHTQTQRQRHRDTEDKQAEGVGHGTARCDQVLDEFRQSSLQRRLCAQAARRARARAQRRGGGGGGGASEGGSERERERVGSRTHGVKPILANRAEAAAQAADHQQPHLRHKHFPGYYDELTGERESACPVPSTQAARPPTRRCSRAAAPPHGSLIAPAPRWEAWPYCAPLAVGRASTASAAARLQRGHWQRGCVLGTGRLARLTLLVHPPPDRVPRCRRAAGRAPHRRPRCIGDAHAAAHRRNSPNDSVSPTNS